MPALRSGASAPPAASAWLGPQRLHERSLRLPPPGTFPGVHGLQLRLHGDARAPPEFVLWPPQMEPWGGGGRPRPPSCPHLTPHPVIFDLFTRPHLVALHLIIHAHAHVPCTCTHNFADHWKHSRGRRNPVLLPPLPSDQNQVSVLLSGPAEGYGPLTGSDVTGPVRDVTPAGDSQSASLTFSVHSNELPARFDPFSCPS